MARCRDRNPASHLHAAPDRQPGNAFCFDCNRAFCTYCQLADYSCANHKTHRTIKLKELLRQQIQRIAQIRSKLKQYIIKHDTTVNEANKRVDEQNRQLQILNDVIDQFALKLHEEVDELKTIAKQTIQKIAGQKWEKTPATALQKVADETLANIRKVRASLEYEIRRAELDELAMAEKNKDIDALCDQLAAFLQSHIEMPDLSAFDLAALLTHLQATIIQMESKVFLSKAAFIRSLDFHVFLNPERVRLVEQQTFEAQSLVLPSDKKKTSTISGVAHEENTDIIYFADESNPSKIKSLNLKTKQIAEVRVFY